MFPWIWIVAEQCAPRWRLKARPSAVRLDPKRSKGQANCFVICVRMYPGRCGTGSCLVSVKPAWV